MPHFTVEHLRDDQLAEAAPVLRLSSSAFVAEWWESEARALIGRGGGVLVARTLDGSIHGLATYEVVKQPRAGRMLSVPRIVSFELSRKQPARQALTGALRRIAAAFECRLSGSLRQPC